MTGAELDKTTAAGNKAMEAIRADSQAMVAAVAAVNNKKTHTEKSNLENLRSIVGHTDVIVATTDLDSKAKVQTTICM